MALRMCTLALLLALCQASDPTDLRYWPGYEPHRGDCTHAASVWCGSWETAASCGVLRQCKNAFRPHQTPKVVNVTLYMETLCPDCKAFFKTQFYPMWRSLNDSGIVNIDIVPYGNAKERINGHRWVFECQHGAAECEGNQIATCAVGILREPNRWMPYVACLEEKFTRSNVLQVARQCAQANNVSFDHINTCSHNEWGDMLQHHMAVRTEKLQPPHKYVPWITVNGVHNEAIQKQAEKDLLQLVCDTYRGTKPAACNRSASRCYRDVE